MNTRSIPSMILFLALVATAGGASAASFSLHSGDDLYVAGNDAEVVAASRRDLFLAGYRARIGGDVAGDAHAAAFSTVVSAGIGGDLYAAGASVSIAADVIGDASITGFDVSIEDTARIGGNLRVTAGTLSLAAPVDGSVIAGAGVVELDAPIAGDAYLAGSEITFGKRAAVAGTLVYSAPERIDVPNSVAPAERVRYQRPGGATVADAQDWIYGPGLPSVRPSLGTALIAALGTLVLLSVIAALALGLAPERVERLRARADSAPWHTLLLGFVGLSALIGAVPVAAVTLVGLPLVPLILLGLVVLWTLGYLAGVHVLVERLAAGFGARSAGTVPGKLALIVLGISVGALLNYVPLFGWAANVLVLLLGLGAMTSSCIDRLANHDAPRRLTRDSDAITGRHAE